MNGISFPGLGIEEFRLNKIAFTVFGKDIAWYGLLITLGIILSYVYILWRRKKENISEDNVFDVGIAAVICGIIGARLYYVIFKIDSFHSFYDVIAVWNGGLAIYGAIIGGVAAIFVMCKIKKINVLSFLDMTFPAVIMAQGIGRWGNFFNAEAHGGETDIFIRMGIRENCVGEMIYYHPTFLYESLWCFLGFAVLNIIYKNKKFNGEILLCYLAWYSFGRFFIEGLRTDSLYIGTVRVSQLLSLLLFVISVTVLVVVFARRKKKSLNNQ